MVRPILHWNPHIIALFAYISFVVWVLLLSFPPRWLGTAFPCEIGVQIENTLRCDRQVMEYISEVCGRRWCQNNSDSTGHHDQEPVWIYAGDYFSSLELCDLYSDLGNGGQRGRMGIDDLRDLEIPININTASEDDLQSFRGVGPVLAAKIPEQRPFLRPEGILRVRGIGEKKLKKMAARLRLDGSNGIRLEIRRREVCQHYRRSKTELD